MIITQTITDFAPPGLIEGLTEAVALQAIRAIADQARDTWITLAQEQLTESQLDYINGIQQVTADSSQPMGLQIVLLGDVPNQIEAGSPSVDMRTYLLGPKVPVVPVGSGMKGKHQGKKGFYRAIPFSHQNPGGVGVTGTPIGRPYAGHPAVANVNEMAAAIWKAAKKLAPSHGMPGGKITYGGRLPAGMAPKLRSHHKSDIYAGLIRSQKTYAKATQSTFTTFRTISTNGTGWIRGAVAGKNLCGKVAEEVRTRIAPETFQALLGRKA